MTREQWAPPSGRLRIKAQVLGKESDIVICSTNSKFHVYLGAQFIFILTAFFYMRSL